MVRIPLLTAILMMLGSQAIAADGQVILDLVLEVGFPIGDQQDWLRTCQDVGADRVTIRSARPTDEVSVKNVGTADRPVYQVVGLLTNDNRLILPGGTFRQGDRARIASWIGRLRDDGDKQLTMPKHAFGLTATQLVSLHEDLRKQVSFATSAKTPKEVVRGIAAVIDTRIEIHPSARNAFDDEWVVPEEMQGLTAGTVLAASIRPLGLVPVPQRPQGEVTKIVLTDARQAREHWPVGWPLQGAPIKAAPKLYEKIDVEIGNYALSEALLAIEQQAGTTLLYDHNAMERHGVNLQTTTVTLPATNLYYFRIIDRLIKQSEPKLKCEVRADEAGRPFVWITTMRK